MWKQKRMINIYACTMRIGGSGYCMHVQPAISLSPKDRDTPGAIRQRGAIFQVLKINKTAIERKFKKNM
jgi:hypothetical protein